MTTAGEITAGARERIAAHLVGRERELELTLAAVAAGRDIVLEGPPGTSKTTILQAITGRVGHSARVRRRQRRPHAGEARRPPQPGARAPRGLQRGQLRRGPAGRGGMRTGGFLYIEEFNRAPEDTLNTLLTAMADRSIAVPRRHHRGAADLPCGRLDEPVRQRRHDAPARPACMTGSTVLRSATRTSRLSTASSRCGPGRRGSSGSGSSPTPWPSPARPDGIRMSARGRACAERSTAP